MSTGSPPPGGGNPSSFAKPKVKIPLNMMAYSILLLGPAAGYVWYTSKHEQIEEELQQSKKYASQMRESESKRKDIVNIIRSVPEGNKQGADRLDEVLRAGKVNATTKRKSHIDMETSAFGDDEAVRKSQEFQKSLKDARDAKNEASKNRRKGKGKGSTKDGATADAIGDGSVNLKTNLVKTAALATFGVALAAVATALIGGTGGSSRHK